jgi:hypothetical protein
MAASYPSNNPPSYGAVPSKPYRDAADAESAEPLLFHEQSSAGAGPSNPNAIYNQADNDIPDDFKVRRYIFGGLRELESALTWNRSTASM